MRIVENISNIVLKSVIVTLMCCTLFVAGGIIHRGWAIIQEQQTGISRLQAEAEHYKKELAHCQQENYQLRWDRKYFERLFEAEDEMLNHCREIMKKRK